MMANGKAPLIVNPYGGPGAQSVRDAWGGAGYYFDCILARQGFAVLHVDNRGMANRGKAFAASLRHNFGQKRTRRPDRRSEAGAPAVSRSSTATASASGDGAMAATSRSIP